MKNKSTKRRHPDSALIYDLPPTSTKTRIEDETHQDRKPLIHREQVMHFPNGRKSQK